MACRSCNGVQQRNNTTTIVNARTIHMLVAAEFRPGCVLGRLANWQLTAERRTADTLKLFVLFTGCVIGQ